MRMKMLAVAMVSVQFISILAVHAASPEATTQPTSRPALPARHAIEGYVQGADGRGGQAFVFVVDAETGLPYSNISDHPLTDNGLDQHGGMYVRSGGDRRFEFPGVFPGSYRVIAQSWKDAAPGQKLMDVKSDETTLCGISDPLTVTEDKDPPLVLLKPAGNATVEIDFKQGDTFLFVSTRPLSGDPILQLLAMKGKFLQNLVGMVHMRQGQDQRPAIMHGLPAGKLYFYALVEPDVNSGTAFGSGSAIVKANETVEVSIPLISSYHNEIETPADVASLQAERKRDPRAFDAAIRAALPADYESRVRRNPRRDPFGFNLPADTEITLPSGRRITLRDAMTMEQYLTFNNEARDFAQRRAAAKQPAAGKQ